MVRNRFTRNVALLVLLALIATNFTAFAESLSLFDRLKIKAQQKFDQIRDPHWLKTQAGGSSIAFAVGKVGGLMGAAVGGLLGLCVGGPAGGAMGMFLGFRIGNVLTKTFVKPLGVAYTESKLKKESFNLQEAISQLDKKKLSIAGTGAVIGDLIGGTMGAAAGVALLAGCGPVTLPILGAVAGVVIGQKIGRAIGASIGKFLVRSAAVAGYKALAAKDPEETPEHPATPVVAGKTTQADAQKQYEDAYRRYVAAQSNPGVAAAEKQRLLNAYQEATRELRAAESTRE